MADAEKENSLFTPSASGQSVRSERILYTASFFAKTNLLYLQEIGQLTALTPHTSRRDKLVSCLCVVVESGKGSLMYDGMNYRLETGDVVFIDCQKPYSHSTDAGDLWHLKWCHFYGTSVQAIYMKYCERGGSPVFHTKNIEVYRELLSELYAIADSDDYIRDMRINEKLSILLTYLMAESWHPERHQTERVKKLDVKQIKAFVDNHYAEKITLESLAENFFINKNYLARLFKDQYGMTLTSYIQRVRITHAKMMLRFTDKKAEEIGMLCGYGELSYFSRVFKKIEGISLSEYRNMW